MTELDTTPAPVSPEEQQEFEVMRTDAVLAGRAMSSGEFIAGLIADAELETVGRPDKLAADLFPGVDAAVVQAVWDRALAVGFYAGKLHASPRLYRDQMHRIAGQFEEIGHVAMEGLVRRSRRLVAPEGVHPADDEAGRGH